MYFSVWLKFSSTFPRMASNSPKEEISGLVAALAWNWAIFSAIFWRSPPVTSPRASLRSIIQSLHLPESSRGLDVGCGIGLQEPLLARLLGEKLVTDKEVEAIRNRLRDEGFLSRAPAAVVEKNRKQLEGLEERRSRLSANLSPSGRS